MSTEEYRVTRLSQVAGLPTGVMAEFATAAMVHIATNSDLAEHHLRKRTPKSVVGKEWRDGLEGLSEGAPSTTSRRVHGVVGGVE